MKKISVLVIIATFVLSACNIPMAAESAEAVQTYAALTVEAALNNSGNTVPTPLASPTLESQNNSGSGDVQATATISTTGDPFASFEDVTNCRTGPGVNYERITQILPSNSVALIGFYPPNYWIVMTDAGPCWVSGQFVTPSGSLAAVPTVTAPPTPQGGAPNSVSVSWDYSCNYVTNQANVTLQWSDKDGETGYRVFRNGDFALELPANSTYFAETITLLAGQSVAYYVVAFNGAGETSSKSIALYC